MIGVVLSAVLLAAAGPGEKVLVRSDHAEIVIGDEHYRLVTRQAPLRAVVMNSSGKKRLVINVVRIGEEDEAHRGGTPLKVKVGRRRHVFPNRPSLVDNRRVTRLGKGAIASFPVRYPMRLRRGRQVPIRISLRKPKAGGKVGILLTLEDPQDTLLTPLTPRGEKVVAKPAPEKKPEEDRQRRRRRRRTRKPDKDKPSRVSAAENDNKDTGEPEQPAEKAPADDDKHEKAAQVASAKRVVLDAGVPADDSERADAGPEAEADAGRPPAVAQPAPPPPPPAPTTGSLRVVVLDKMGGDFVLEVAEVSIDGRPVVGGPTAGSQRVLFDGGLPPGQHDVQVHLAYRVDGGWMFSYLDGYTFHLSDAALVDLGAGDDVRVVVTGEQRGGWFTELEDKPSIDVKVVEK